MRMDYSVFRMLCKESVPAALIFKMIKYIILWKSVYLSAERFNLIVIIITVGSMYNKIKLHNGSVNGAVNIHNKSLRTAAFEFSENYQYSFCRHIQLTFRRSQQVSLRIYLCPSRSL